MSGRDKMSEALFDAVGSIDDAFVAEAMEYKRIIKRKSLIKTLAAVAAVILLVISIGVPAFIGANFLFGGKGGKATESNYEVLSLPKTGSVDFGTAALIWQKDGQEDYSYIVISESQAKSLAEKTNRALAGDDAGTNIRVWIKFDNGEYVSPQLQKSDGNIGLTTFDFSPELELSETIANIINNSESGGSE